MYTFSLPLTSSDGGGGCFAEVVGTELQRMKRILNTTDEEKKGFR